MNVVFLIYFEVLASAQDISIRTYFKIDALLVDGVYVTTRGCSTKQWEDVDVYFDHRNQDLRCFRRGTLEQCLCSRDSCNGTQSMWSMLSVASIAAAAISVLCITNWLRNLVLS